MRKIDDRVKISGSVSREVAEAMKRGDLKSNNGLRQAHGRASFHSEQPDFWLDETPSFGQQLTEGIKADVGAGIRYAFNRLLYNVIIPKLETEIKYRVFPWAGRQWQKLTAPKITIKDSEKESIVTRCNKAIDAGQTNSGCKVIDFNSHRTA